MTNGLLLQFHAEVSKLQASVLMYLLKTELNQFYETYATSIDSAIESKAKLQREYFVFDGQAIKHEGEGKDSKPVMLEGKTYGEFMKEYTDLMNQPVVKPLVLHKA